MAEIDPTLIPRQVPRSARAAIIVGGYLADSAGEVPEGVHGLHGALGNDAVASTWKAVREAQAWKLMTASGHHGPIRSDLWVMLAKLQADACDLCGKPGILLGRVRRKRGERPRCRACYQMAREDRGAWRERALQVWVTSKGLGLTEAQTVYRIARTLKLPLYPSPGEDPGTQAIVPWLVSQRLVAPEWATFAARASAGVVVDD